MPLWYLERNAPNIGTEDVCPTPLVLTTLLACCRVPTPFVEHIACIQGICDLYPISVLIGDSCILQGQGFEAGVQCVLLDTATSYNVTVNATIISGSTANCTLPAYDSPTGNDSMVTLQVTWLDGCTLAPAYGLYPVPNMVSLWPRTVPRYGGGPLYLQLETSLTGTSLESVRTCTHRSPPPQFVSFFHHARDTRQSQ